MAGSLSIGQRQIARQTRLLASLPDEIRENLLDASHIISYQRGEAIFFQGDTARALHIVIDGWVKLYRITQNGNETVVHIFSRGQSFGEPIALQRSTYPVSAEAATDCHVISVPSDALLAILSTHPKAAISIISSMLIHLQGLVEQIEQLKARSGTQRVAAFILELCPEGIDNTTVMMPYDKTLIAGRLGMQPESLSRAFGRLRKYGVDIDHNQVRIGSVAKLRQLVLADSR